MRYKNKVTGAVFDSPFAISGGNWALVESKHHLNERENDEQKAEEIDNSEIAEEKNQNTEQEEPDQETKTDDPAFDSITVPQIKQELDAFGIKYSATAKKQELYDLMMAQGK
ncbi:MULTISPECIES: hypothetical protein [Enterococcus]|uniref:hypothetical protein n=1 Tax=Enterococcus TaxID=1350 RepID=UPI001A0EB02A